MTHPRRSLAGDLILLGAVLAIVLLGLGFVGGQIGAAVAGLEPRP